MKLSAMVIFAMCFLFFVPEVKASVYLEDSVTPVYTDDKKHNVVGTGFFIRRHLIMTNKHVVGSADTVAVRVHGKFVTGKVVLKSIAADLALIKIKGRGQRPFPICKNVKTGDEIEIWAYDNTIMSKKAGVITYFWITDFYSTVVSYGGNSGSPTVRDGKCLAGVLWGGAKAMSAHVTAYKVRRFLARYDQVLKKGREDLRKKRNK